jgi:hypothetical protein
MPLQTAVPSANRYALLIVKRLKAICPSARPHAGAILLNACQRDAGRVEFRQSDVGLIGDSPAAGLGVTRGGEVLPSLQSASDTGDAVGADCGDRGALALVGNGIMVPALSASLTPPKWGPPASQMTARPVPTRHRRSYGNDPLPTRRRGPRRTIRRIPVMVPVPHLRTVWTLRGGARKPQHNQAL